MKKLFLALLAVNALVFLWWQFDASDEQVLNTSLPSIDASQNLVLLSESDEARKQGNLNKKSNENDKTTPDAVASKVRNVIISDAEPVVAVELQSSNKVLVADQRSCYTIGPLVSQIRAKEVKDELMRLGAGVNQRITHASLHIGYRVYMSPLPSLAEARDMLHELKRQGVNDSAIIRQGEYKNAISLGVFSMRDGAKRHQKAMIQKGLDVKMADRYRDSEQYWFDIYDVGQAGSLSSAWSALSEKYPEIKKQAINCK